MGNATIFLPIEISMESFQVLLPDFFEEIEEDFELMRLVDLNNGETEIQKIAHKIKGSAATYGAVLIAEKAKILEECIIANLKGNIERCVNEVGESIRLSHDYAVLNFGISD